MQDGVTRPQWVNLFDGKYSTESQWILNFYETSLWVYFLSKHVTWPLCAGNKVLPFNFVPTVTEFCVMWGSSVLIKEGLEYLAQIREYRHNTDSSAQNCGNSFANARNLSVLHRADTRFAPNQWETALLCNDVSHWLGAYLEWALLALGHQYLVRKQ